MTKKNKSRLVTASVVILLCGIFVGMFTYGLSAVLDMEGAFPPVVNVEGVSAAPTDEAGVVNYLNAVIQKAVSQRPKLVRKDEFDIDRGEDGSYIINTDGSAQFKESLLYCREQFDERLDEKLGTRHKENSSMVNEILLADYGEDFGTTLNIPKITAEDIIEFNCDYVYYKCMSCGNESHEKLPGCENCGSPNEYEMQYRNEYTVIAKLDCSDKLLDGNFNRRNPDEFSGLYEDAVKGFFEVKNLGVDYSELAIIFKVNRMTDEISYLEYQKKVAVSCEAEFTDKYASLGKAGIETVIDEFDRYYFTWPGIRLNNHTMTVEPKGTNNLLATLTCDDPKAYTVKWASSDEAVLTIDDEGYIKAGKDAGKATVTASFEFGGKTYTDECEVSVCYSAESSSISKKKLNLNVGDSEQLSVTVKPKNATNKAVKWYTEDEKIATVDENGIVKAVSAGKTTVYSLTEDGYFRSTCEVTVK